MSLQADSQDEIGAVAGAFNDMSAQLNDLLRKISTASQQVASGSRNIADSGNTLADGAARQASSVEELSASIAEINAQLTALKPGNIATVVYYCDYAQEYHQITGAVRKVDAYWKLLQIGNMSIDFCEIADIEKVAIPV